MQEKATISRLENIVGWIGSIILSIGLFLAAFLLAMDCANAEELPIELQEQIIDMLDNDLNVPVNQSYLDNCFSCPYCAVYNINNGSHNIYYFDFYFTKNIGYLYERYGGRYYYATSMYFEYTGSNRGYITCSSVYDGTIGTGYRIIVDGNSYYYGSVTATSSNVVQSTNFNITGLPSTYSDIYGYDIYSNSTSSYTYNVLISYGDCYLQNGSSFAVHEDTYTPPPTTNTAGFDCYKLDTKGGIYFVADFSSLITFDHSTTNTSTFSCDVHLDDTIQTITLDSTSEYYLYDVDHREAEYSYPITAFVPNYTDYEHVWIDNVKVINTYSGHGGSVDSTFVYITPIDILGSFPEEELTPTIIPQVSPVPDNLEGYGIDYHSGDELKTLYNNNMFNQWITESEFYSDIAQLGGGRSVKLVGATDQNVYENNTDNTLAYLSNVASILSGTADVPGTGAVMTVVYGVNAFFDTINAPRNNGQIDFNGAAEEYIKDNLYSSTYDIIILEAYYDAEALQTNTNDLLYTPIPSIDDLHAGEPYAGKIFYVILTQRYIESLNLDGLGSLQKLLESDVYYAKATYEYLYDRLNDFEDKSLDGIKDIIGLDNQIFDRLGNIDTYIQRIEGLLKKVLDAILSLNIQPTDTTAIEQKLDDIYIRLGNSNLNSDWYKRYREWLYDETNDNVLNTPHEYMLNTFDDVKALFDVFAYFDLPQTGFWSSAREYLNRMNGNTYNDNINDYLVTGIGSQNFYKDNCNTLVWSDIE